jgi:IclR family transcriptional regulator, KDG regulon repressor
MAGENFISIVAKALTVLESLREADHGLSLKEIAVASGLPKTTTYRILFTLEEQGYVEKLAGDGMYRLTTRLMNFNAGKADHQRLKAIAHPVMERLLAEFQETVNLGVIEQNQVLYLEVLESTHTFRLAAKVGQRGSIHATALGKAIVSYQEGDRPLSAVRSAGLTKFTDHTISSLSELQKEFRRVRQRGYAIDEQESMEGVRCVAAPVFDSSGQTVAGISVSGPGVRMTQEAVHNIAEMLIDGCAEISARLGYQKQKS